MGFFYIFVQQYLAHTMSCQTFPSDEQGCLNFTLIRGDNKSIVLEFFKSEDDEDVPLDLAGHKVVMEIRTHGEQAKPISIKKDGSGLVVYDNKVSIVFDKDDDCFKRSYTSLLYDIAIVRLSDNWSRHWLKGTIKLIPSQTKTWQTQ